jgi:transcription termination factor NusB
MFTFIFNQYDYKNRVRNLDKQTYIQSFLSVVLTVRLKSRYPMMPLTRKTPLSRLTPIQRPLCRMSACI